MNLPVVLGYIVMQFFFVLFYCEFHCANARIALGCPIVLGNLVDDF